MCIIKRITYVLLIGVFAFFTLIKVDSFFKPVFKHSLFVSQSIGAHYFVNDLVGVSPMRSPLPKAYVLSHSARATVLIGDERQQYQLVPADNFGLTQDPEISGWGALREHVVGDGVLHLYYYRTFVVGVYQPTEKIPAQHKLKISIPWSAIYGASGGVDIASRLSESSTYFDIAFNSAGRFWIETQPPPSDGFAISFLQQGFLPGEVLVGANEVVVNDKAFALSTRDMHSLALTELDGDAGVEFSVVRGGMRGKIGVIDPDATDLLVDSETGLNIARSYKGFMKNGCPGRQSAWSDIDSDGDLDLYVSCGRPKEPAADFPNQLFENTGNGFVENGKKFGVNFKSYGAFRFIDWDGDLDPDLWWAGADGELNYYENKQANFVLKETYLGSWQGSYRPPQLLIQDLANNGAPDLFVTHPSGNLLLVNLKGSSTLKKLAGHGLPEKTVAGHWADINLDGNTDLITAEDGVYLNQGSLKFLHNESDFGESIFLNDARLVSFYSEEGRQFFIAYRPCLPGKLCGARRVILSQLRTLLPLRLDWLEWLGLVEPYDWVVQVIKSNVVSETHKEIAITLQGTKNNPYALGGMISLEWGGKRQAHWVAESESSLYSQADMNIYFSVPESENVKGKAIWPDGCMVDFKLPLNINSIEIKRPLTCSIAGVLKG